MDYKRLTDKDIAVTLNFNAYEDNTRFFNYAHRLWELENAIENGELIFKANVNNTKTISGSSDKFFDIVTQVQKHGRVINPITED